MSDNSGTAFPRADCGTPGASPYYPGTPGLTKRELFAALIFAEGMKIAADVSKDSERLSVVIVKAAGYSVVAADALLAELAK